jgi:formyltetrahydrofolate deformylase
MRIDFTMAGQQATAESLRADFAAVAQRFDMSFEIWGARAPYRTLIMVSKQLHCLNDLLFRTSNGSLQIDIPVVVSNHRDAEALVRSHGIEFRHIPVTPETKDASEDELMALHDELGIHLVVSPATCRSSPTTCAASSPARRSTSTTRSCPASRAHGPTTRRSSEA